MADRSVEDILARIRAMPGVEGYLIVDNEVRTAVQRGRRPCVRRRPPRRCPPHCRPPRRRRPRAQGSVLRCSKSLSASEAATLAAEMMALTRSARRAVRDVTPRSDLCVLRLRGHEREILAAPGPGEAFLIVVIQWWLRQPPEPLAALATAAGGGSAAVTATALAKR